MHLIHPERIRQKNSTSVQNTGPVIYWMSRDQRLEDNWAVLYAQNVALELQRPLEIIFILAPKFLDATLRQYDFMLSGLKEISEKCYSKNISFSLIVGDCVDEIPVYISRKSASALITDFSPLRIKKQWVKEIVKNIEIPLFVVDAHNIVPCWEASSKQEYAAYTFRPKIQQKLSEFFTDFEEVLHHPFGKSTPTIINKNKLMEELFINKSVQPVTSFLPGSKAGASNSSKFLGSLNKYKDHRNDPTQNAQSNLSPYLHFGQLSAQRVALEVSRSMTDSESIDIFFEEVIVRRELSDNYCYYNDHYDTYEGFPAWAKMTLNEHNNDPREFLYSQNKFEKAETHDLLWNAAQTEMVTTGKMHGYMRMYWAKKILEWTHSPEEAQMIAIYLNDKYELDGRDPNGYTGIAWSIGGVHDRAWPERKIFGKIRYMNYNGAKRKFDTEAYISKHSGLL